MTDAQRLRNLEVPQGQIDAVLDTDTFNEIDDQFALAYMLRAKERIRMLAVYAAPFLNEKSVSPADGMEKSYQELGKVLALCGENVPAYRGSTRYLPDEQTPVCSEAAENLVALARAHSAEAPLYVVAIGAITNVASALLMDPAIAERIVVVWLGGHAAHYTDTCEFNMKQDVAAARVVMGSAAPFVQLPCMGVVSGFAVSGPELEHWFVGKNELSTYLARNAIREAESYAAGKAWTRVIWDVTAVAWLLNDGGRFLKSRLIATHLPGYDHHYTSYPDAPLMRYVYHVERDALLNDLIDRLTQG